MKRFVWQKRLQEESEERLLEMQNPKRRRRNQILDAVIAAAALALIVTAILDRRGYLLIPVCVVLVLRSVFWSRNGSRTVKAFCINYVKALREERAATVPHGLVVWNTLLASSPIYVICFSTAFLLALGGFYAWLYISIPTLFFAVLIFKSIALQWHEMDLSRARFWALQLGCYFAAILPGVLTAGFTYR